MIIENIRVSKKGRDQLIRLKRKTGIKTWNVLCRWALLKSLSEVTAPPVHPISLDSNLEMTWKTFVGPHGTLYSALIKQRLLDDGINITTENLAQQFVLHLHRGISYAVGVSELVELIANARHCS